MSMGIEGNYAPPSSAAVSQSAIEAKADKPANDVAKIETPKIDAFNSEVRSIETVQVELPIVEAPKLADVKAAAEPDALSADATELPASPVAEPAAASPASKRSYRFALLAASVAGAAAIGALCGALGAAALMRPADLTAAGDETRTLQSGLAELRTDLAALRTIIETATKSTNGQFAKIAERFDRVDRAQADPAARIAKAAEAMERLVGRDTTGSISAPKSANAAMPGQASQAQVVEGWIVREVYRGTAIVQGRGFGAIEVEAGDTIPGVGRVEAIRKQDSRWVVVTSRGIITSPR